MCVVVVCLFFFFLFFFFFVCVWERERRDQCLHVQDVSEPFKDMKGAGFYWNKDTLHIVSIIYFHFFHGFRNWTEIKATVVLTLEASFFFFSSSPVAVTILQMSFVSSTESIYNSLTQCPIRQSDSNLGTLKIMLLFGCLLIKRMSCAICTKMIEIFKLKFSVLKSV